MALTAPVTILDGRPVIATDAFIRLNTRAHAPWLAKLGPDGALLWQDKLRLGYGKSSVVYYAVDGLMVGDWVRCAGGSSGNKYPQAGIVTEITETTVTIDPQSERAWRNEIARRARAAVSAPTA